MEKPNWPIRIGGEYTAFKGGRVVRRVTAIEGNQVYYELRTEGELLTRDRLTDHYFREVSNPEDGSPLPAVIHFLEQLVADNGSPQYYAYHGQQLLDRINGKA